MKLGRFSDGERCYRHALAVAGELGYGIGEGKALMNLGDLYAQWQRPGAALDHGRQAVAVARQIGYRTMELTALNVVGEASRALGRPAEAVANHQLALDLAHELDEPLEQARALEGLATALLDIGDRDGARQRFRDALKLYADLGVPEADRVGARLDGLDGGPTR